MEKINLSRLVFCTIISGIIAPISLNAQTADRVFDIGLGVESVTYSSEIPPFLIGDKSLIGNTSYFLFLGDGSNESNTNAYSLHLGFLAPVDAGISFGVRASQRQFTIDEISTMSFPVPSSNPSWGQERIEEFTSTDTDIKGFFEFEIVKEHFFLMPHLGYRINSITAERINSQVIGIGSDYLSVVGDTFTDFNASAHGIYPGLDFKYRLLEDFYLTGGASFYSEFSGTSDAFESNVLGVARTSSSSSIRNLMFILYGYAEGEYELSGDSYRVGFEYDLSDWFTLEFGYRTESMEVSYPGLNRLMVLALSIQGATSTSPSSSTGYLGFPGPDYIADSISYSQVHDRKDDSIYFNMIFHIQ